MYKVAVVGDKDSVMGFTALGLDVFPVYDADEVKKKLHALAEKDYAIIYITEKYAIAGKEAIDRYKDNELPAIIVIPGITGSMGIGMNEVRESAKRAIGADILFGED
jgi:V/A-type H+-transporting ATPase subunit F